MEFPYSLVFAWFAAGFLVSFLGTKFLEYTLRNGYFAIACFSIIIALAQTKLPTFSYFIIATASGALGVSLFFAIRAKK